MYTVDYFIEKFEAIPDKKWCSGDLVEGRKKCAAGHCGVTLDYFDDSENFLIDDEATKAVNELGRLLMPLTRYTKPYEVVYSINDGFIHPYREGTPKQRILAALRDIKELSNGQEAQVSDTTKMPNEQDAGKTIHVYHTVKVSETIFDQAKEILSHN